MSSFNRLHFTGEVTVTVRPVYQEENGSFIDIEIDDTAVQLDRGDTRILADYLHNCLEEE